MAPPSSPKIIELRQMLDAQRQARVQNPATLWQCGDPLVDDLQIPRAALTEIVADPFHSPGSALLLHGFLHLALGRQRVILIDAQNAFDPSGFPQSLLNRLLWLRCNDALQAIKAADLVLRDGNISLALFFCLLNPARELKKIPSQAWHRLQLLTEKSAVTFLVFTPFPLIGSARLRVAVEGSFSLADLDRSQEDLRHRLHLQTIRRRLSLTPDELENLRDESRGLACA
jgi:hypothetical protein